MRKIKRFKIPVYYRDLSRRVERAGIDLSSAGITGEAEFREFVSCLAGMLNAGVVFENFDSGCHQLDEAGVKTVPLFTSVIVTLGHELEDKIRSFSQQPERQAASIAACGFFDNAADFVINIIKEEAARENFQLLAPEIVSAPLLGENTLTSPYLPLFLRDNAAISGESSSKALPFLMDKLSAAKIGVDIKDGRLWPEMTAAFLIPWESRKKGKKK